LYGPVVSVARNGRDGQNLALRRSREPLASNPIELPSYKAAPLQASGQCPHLVFAHEDGCFVLNQIAPRGLKQILDWEKALAESLNRTL
jgi:hypothetical protein